MQWYSAYQEKKGNFLPWSARAARSVKIAKKRLQRNPCRRVQKMAKGLKMSVISVRSIVKEG